jgi:beta-lactamase regulating signal transducer with metallopeptidase domain
MTAGNSILLSSHQLLFLLNVAVASSLACGAALVGVWLCRRAPTLFRYHLLRVGLALALCSPLLVHVAERLEMGWIRLPEELSPSVPALPAAEPGDATDRLERAHTFLFLPDVTAGEEPGTKPQGAVSRWSFLDWLRGIGTLLAVAWLVGCAWSLIRLACGQVRVARLRASCRRSKDSRILSMAARAAAALGLERAPQVLTSSLLPVPGVVGLVRPRVVLPEDLVAELDDPSLEAVLLHELVHVARRDPWLGLAQRLAAALYWWCPLMHGLNRRLGELGEHLCDDQVVHVQGAGDRYARLLIDLAERLVGGSGVRTSIGLFGEARNGLEGRVRRLLRKENDTMLRLSFATKLLVALFLGGVGGMLAVAGVHAAEPSPQANLIGGGDESVAQEKAARPETKPEEPVRDEDLKDKRAKIEEAIKQLEEAGFKEKAELLKERLKKLAQPGGEPKEKTKRKPAAPETDKDIRQNLEEMVKRLIDAGQMKAAERVKEALKDLGEAKPKSDTKPDKKPAPPLEEKDWRGRMEEAIKRMEEAMKRLEGAGLKEPAEQVKEALMKMRQAGVLPKGKTDKPAPPADRTAEIEKKLDQLTRELEELRRELKKQK